jgi:hypothetical protein
MAAFQPRATDYLSPLHELVGIVPDTTVQAGVPRLSFGALRDLQLKPGASIAILRPSAVADPAFYHGRRRKGCH